MNLRNVRIGVRLAIGFGVILALLTVVVVTGNVINGNNTNTLTKALEATNAKTSLAYEMRGALLETAVAMRNTALQSEVAATQQEEEKVDAERKHYAVARDKLIATGLSEEEKKILANIQSIDKEMAEPFVQVIGLTRVFDAESAAKILASTIDPLSRKALAEITKLVEIQQAAATQMMLSTEAAGKKLQLQLYLIGAIALAIGMACAWVLTRSITNPLQNAVAVAERVAAGDLTSQVSVAGKDEVSQLLAALQRMNNNLFETVTKVRQGTDTIATASTEITAGNLDLSSRTEQQASSLEETASSMEELTSTVKQNSENARQANQLAISASDVAVKGGAVVTQVVDTMASINASSKKIVDIISVIDGIAFQTNILALNAAVEAARAGEQGRGFAVVATEVRNLAQRSAGAAKEIKSLIDDSVENVDAGTKLVDQAGTTMNAVVDSVKRVTDIMAEIMAASQEQASGIEQVNQAISQMDQVTQQNAALVEQAAAAAESLQDQARNLSEIVSIFKLDNSHGLGQVNRTIDIAPRDRAEPELLAHNTPRARIARSRTA
jgi:methyl-accepting chemotaxis protein